MFRPNRKTLCLAAIAVVCLVAAPMVTWAARSSLHIDGSTTAGNTVLVRVSNTSHSTQSGLLSVTAVVDGDSSTVAQMVTVAGSSAGYATVQFASAVDFVLQAKIVDSRDPI